MSLLVSFVTFVWSILNTVLRGYLIKTFWLWFIVSQFPSLPTISILPAIGFIYVVSALSPVKGLSAKDWTDIQEQKSVDKNTLGMINAALLSLVTVLTLGMGWVVHHFM